MLTDESSMLPLLEASACRRRRAHPSHARLPLAAGHGPRPPAPRALSSHARPPPAALPPTGRSPDLADIAANGLGGGVVARRLLWGDEADIAAVAAEGPFDLIVGSDLLYNPASSAVLVETLSALSTAGRTEVLLTCAPPRLEPRRQ